MAGLSSFGTILEWYDGTTWVAVGGVQDIEGPGLELGTEDATTHDSPDGFEERVATTISGGEVSFTVQYIPSSASHAWDAAGGLPYMLKSRQAQQFRVKPTDPNYTKALQFSAFVTKFAPKFPVKGGMTADVTLAVTGKVEEVTV